MIRLAVLGDPVDHSLSPRLHRAAFRASGLAGAYERRRVDEVGLEQAADEIRCGRLRGANITMPHKVAAALLSDELGPTAGRTGSVNTWVGESGRLIGYSTDGEGIRFAIERGQLPTDAGALILGAGGAASAALVALSGRHLMVSARRQEAASALAMRVGSDAEIVPWGAPVPGSLVINATPLGMAGEALPDGIVESASGLLDMVYGETMTPAVALALQRGIPVSDGVPMLIGQALESFRLWTGRHVPPEAMLDAANLSSGRAERPKKQSNDPSGVEPCR